jgi:hypothetical protein
MLAKTLQVSIADLIKSGGHHSRAQLRTFEVHFFPVDPLFSVAQTMTVWDAAEAMEREPFKPHNLTVDAGFGLVEVLARPVL